MNADLAAVFFSLILGISVYWIQASSNFTTTESSLSSSSTTASPQASSTGNTPLVFATPRSTSKPQVLAGGGGVNSTDLSTTTSPSSSSIVPETSTILASISRNATVSSITAASLTPFSGILSTSQSKAANFTEENTAEIVSSSVGSLSASASTILTSSHGTLLPSQTTSSSSLSSSKRTVSSSGLESPLLDTTQASFPSTTIESSPSSSSTTASPKGSSTGNTTSVFPTPSSPAMAQVSSGRGRMNSADLSTTTQASFPSTTTESSPSSSSTTASTKGSSTGNTTSVFPTPSSPARAQVSSGRGRMNSTDLSTTTQERLSSYPASTPATHTPSPRPTIPPEETKVVNMEVTLNMEFRKEYNDVNSPVYKELVANLSKALFRVYQEVDGFVDVRVLFIRRGSIVCNYIIILASNSEVTDDDLKEQLHKGSKDDKFPFDVKGIAVIEDSDAVAAKTKLPQWAMTTMIVLGALAFCFLVIAICACIKYRNATSSENYIYDVPPGKLDMRAYDAISMGHMRANVDGNTSTAQRRLVSSHENPTYGS
ncbi:uncharacterized protein [Acropora muricata]|uniref:uncharacterized protein isoform X2 n=1 Tax=Acropora muricata TaxID=159855 RepID=UPI0034E41335